MTNIIIKYLVTSQGHFSHLFRKFINFMNICLVSPGIYLVPTVQKTVMDGLAGFSSRAISY